MALDEDWTDESNVAYALGQGDGSARLVQEAEDTTRSGASLAAIATMPRYAEASTLANFDYAAMIWAILLGWLFFGELPAPAIYAGAVIVIGSGLFIVWRERQLGLRRAEETVEPG